MEPETMKQTLDATAQNPVAQHSFASGVQQCLQNYFARLEGEEPNNLYNLVLAELEVPLLRTVMRYTNNNQSRAAKIMGISRGTLRKKLAIYQLSRR